jgi:type IV pilus assembly protein PilV
MGPVTRKSHPRGTTLIEAMVAMSIVLIGLLGLAQIQTLVVRTNHFAKRMAQASALAVDMEENIKRWGYTDSRLNSPVTVLSMNDNEITSRWDMGRGTTTSYQAHFSDKASDPNAVTPNALGATFQGLPTDIDADGTADFTRYWNVITVNTTGTPTANGKLVQIIIRWREPGLGFRQVTASAFKPNPAVALE